MWINGADQGFKIVDVGKGTPADVAGLRAGDVITAVDGKPVKAIHLYDLRKRLRNDAVGTTVTMTVSRDGQTRTAKLTLRDLLG
jgi:S1-C subfamily serine protease